MKYSRFVVRNYHAIVGPLSIDVAKPTLTPIIGVNESGKTTVLHALFAFDHSNDQAGGGRHVRDTQNLYATNPVHATVQATIELDAEELSEAVNACREDPGELEEGLKEVVVPDGATIALNLTRDITALKYGISEEGFGSEAVQDAIAREIVARAPFILFFDDFRDKVDERIQIIKGKDGAMGDWLAIMQELFKKTDASLSVFKIPGMEERQRKSVLAKVEKYLNDTLTKQWQHFRLENREALAISLEYQLERSVGGVDQHFLRLDVAETDDSGDRHFFFISDRSKGFYWFFNFVMKLEFNPKVMGDSPTVYLLDEPGSYLHASAQQKLCKKLRQLARDNRVLYCTHSHYLLDPDTIPINGIHVAQRDEDGQVTLVRMSEYEGVGVSRRAALQPVLDALQIKPFALDLVGTHVTVLVEGIYDYFAIDMFRGNREVSILPSVNAESIKYYVSLLIAWGVPFRAVWDNDPEGVSRYKEARSVFGEEVAARSFRLLPKPTRGRRRILQNLFDGADLRMFRRRLSLAENCSFERTIQALYYSSERAQIVSNVSEPTRRNFLELFEVLTLPS